MWIILLLTDMVVNSNFEKQGIKKNTSEYLLNNGWIKTICFDKTGTLT